MIPGVETAIIKTVEWGWESFGKDIVKISVGQLKELWQNFEFKHAAERYAEKTRRLYGTMHIWRMTSSVPLESIFTNVNILDTPSAFQRTPKEHLEKMYHAEASFGKIIGEGQDGLEAVREHNRLFILGKPGAGKTTFLKYITLQALDDKLDGIPIFVPLKSFSESGTSLFEFIVQQFDICNFPEAQTFIKTALEKPVYFRLTDYTFDKLRENGVAKDVIDKLLNFREHVFLDKDKFMSSLEKVVGTTKYKSIIKKDIESYKGKILQIKKNFSADLEKLLKEKRDPKKLFDKSEEEKEIPKKTFDQLTGVMSQKYSNKNEFINNIQKKIKDKEYRASSLDYFKKRKDNIFEIDPSLFHRLQKRLPLDVFAELESLKNRDYENKEEFINDLEKIVMIRYQSLILHYAQKKKAIILCDGLDEVNKEDGGRDRVIQELTNFSRKYDESQFIITCRVAATEYLFENFTYVEMADFDNNKIRQFVYKWFSDDKNIANRFFYEFEKNRNNRFKELARNPLILTLLCIAFEETLTFPNRRSEIYEEALDALLKKWDTSRRINRDGIYQDLPLGRKKHLFARIAAETFENGEYLLEQQVLEEKVVNYLQNLPSPEGTFPSREHIDGSAIIKAIEAQHGIFIERAQRIYSFFHLTFQEYYTAKYIVENRRLEHLINEHFTDETWREIFFLTAEMLQEADEFFSIFLSALDNFISYDKRLSRLLTKIEIVTDALNITEKPFEIRKRILERVLNEKTEKVKAFVVCINVAGTNELVTSCSNISNLDDIDTAIIKAALNRVRSCSFSTKIHIPYDDIQRLMLPNSPDGLYTSREILSHLRLPSKSTDLEWFTSLLLKCIMTDSIYAFDSYYYEFEQEQVSNLQQYLKFTAFLRECLEIAYVTDRTSIEENLFRKIKS